MMTKPVPGPNRRGITLTEILISILIMGVGMLSLATLFPLGLERLRQATRASRSSLLTETATEEMQSRNLLNKQSFSATWFPFFDPMTQDPAPGESGAGLVWPDPSILFPFNNASNFPNDGVSYSLGISTGLDRFGFNAPFSGFPSPPNTGNYIGLVGGTGLPFCYDPMWWYQVAQTQANSATFNPLTSGEFTRFGSGIGLLRDDPVASGAPSAWGLRRLTNIPYTIDPSYIFASNDDPVMQSDGNANPSSYNAYGVNITGKGSTVVPDLSLNANLVGHAVPTYDYSYTWLFTGRQTDFANGSVFDGDLVIMQNRPFALNVGKANPLSSTAPNPLFVPAGETVVEAIWGYGPPPSTNPLLPYSINDTTVLLRWPTSQADPDVRVGGWIADVTYERFWANEFNPNNNGLRFYPNAFNPNVTPLQQYYPAQRCYWYQVVKRTQPAADHQLAGYRQTIVTVSSSLRARTPIAALGNNGFAPAFHIEAALVSPYVVNVVPRVFYTR